MTKKNIKEIEERKKIINKREEKKNLRKKRLPKKKKPENEKNFEKIQYPKTKNTKLMIVQKLTKENKIEKKMREKNWQTEKIHILTIEKTKRQAKNNWQKRTIEKQKHEEKEIQKINKR